MVFEHFKNENRYNPEHETVTKMPRRKLEIKMRTRKRHLERYHAGGRKVEHGRKLRRKSFRKTKTDGKAWFIDDPHKGGNVKGKRLQLIMMIIHFSKTFLILSIPSSYHPFYMHSSTYLRTVLSEHSVCIPYHS
jgi:hypothetical protein